MADEFQIQMIVATFGREGDAAAALKAIREPSGTGSPSGLSTAVTLRRDRSGALDLESRPDLTGPARAGYEGLVDAVIQMMVGPSGWESLTPGTSALITVADEPAAAEVRNRLLRQSAPLVDAALVDLKARRLIDNPVERVASTPAAARN